MPWSPCMLSMVEWWKCHKITVYCIPQAPTYTLLLKGELVSKVLNRGVSHGGIFHTITNLLLTLGIMYFQPGTYGVQPCADVDTFWSVQLPQDKTPQGNCHRTSELPENPNFSWPGCWGGLCRTLGLQGWSWQTQKVIGMTMVFIVSQLRLLDNELSRSLYVTGLSYSVG